MKPIDHDDFLTAQDARDYEEITYINITSNEAEQFFGIGGLVPQLTDAMVNKSDKNVTDNVVTVISGLPTTVGDIAHTLLNTMSKSTGLFGINPNKTSGMLNRASGAILVSKGVVTEPQMTAFYEIGTTRTKPYENITDEQFTNAKLKKSLVGTSVVNQADLWYSGSLASEQPVVVNRGTRYFFAPKVVGEVPCDCTITVQPQYQLSDSSFVDTDTFTIHLKKGQAPKAKMIPTKNFGGLLRIDPLKTVANISGLDFGLDIKGV